MPVTKNDLAIIANNYFVVTLTAPRHAVTPDRCAEFAYNCYSLILEIPGDHSAYSRLLHYIQSAAEYYGVDMYKAYKYLNDYPGFKNTFFQFIKDNYGIQANPDVVKDLISDAFGFVGSAAAGAISAVLKPFIPIIVFGLILIYATGKALKA